MSDTANAPIDLANNSELIADLARFAEGVLTEQQVRRKWRHLDNSVWDASDDALIDAVEAERVRRVRSGRAAREKAQNLAVQAPDVLGTIMANDGNSPHHRIEAAKELRVVADNGPEVAPAANVEKFLIQINLGNGETFTYPNNNDATPPQKLLPIKQDGNDDGVV